MVLNASQTDVSEGSGRLWSFAGREFDESRLELRVNGKPVELELKPLEILVQLLLHAGEVVTKDALLDAVWPGLTVVEGSLSTAIYKLRKALGDEESAIVLTVPRVGYRLGAPVHSKTICAPPLTAELGFKESDAVPGREHWRLMRALDVSADSEVWLARHPKTRELRVFKFASSAVRLKGLKREVTVSRFLRESLGERPELVRVLEWNFDTHPSHPSTGTRILQLQRASSIPGRCCTRAIIPTESTQVFSKRPASIRRRFSKATLVI